MDELEIEEFEDDFEIDDSFEQLPKPTSATLAEDPDAGLVEKKSSHSHSDDHLTFADFADSSGSGARGGGMLAGGSSKGSSGAAGGGAGPGLFIDNPFTFNDDDTTNKMRSVGKVETPHFSPIESPSEGHAAPEPQGNTNSRTSNQSANAQNAAMSMPDFLKGLSDDEVDSEEEGAALFGIGIGTAGAAAATTKKDVRPEEKVSDRAEPAAPVNSNEFETASGASANKRKSTAGGPLLARSPTSRDMQAASNTMDSHSDDSDAELFKGVAVSNKKKPPVARAQTQRQMSSQGPGSDDLSERSGSGAAGTGSERNAGPVTIGSVDDADLFTLGPAGPPAAGTAASSGATSGGTAGGQGVAVVAGGVAAGEAAAAAGGASGASTASSGASPADQQKGPAASAPRPGSSSPGGRQFVEKIGGGVNYMQPYNPEMGNANKPRVHGPGMPPPLVSETTTTSSEAYTIQDEERPAATDESAPPAIGALPKHGEDVIREEIEGSGETKTGTQKSPVDPNKKSPTDTGINVDNVDPAWLPPQYRDVAVKVMAVYKEEGYQSSPPRSPSPPAARPGTSSVRNRNRLKAAAGGTHDEQVILGEQQAEVGGAGSALTSNRSPTRQGTRGGGSNRQVPDFIRVQKRIDKARKEHVLAELQQMLNETWRHDKNLKMRALKNEWTQQRLEQQKHQEELRMQRIREIEAERNNYVEKQLRDRQNYLRRKEEDRKRKELEQKRFSLLQRVYDEGLRKEKLKELEKEREKHREKFKKKIKFVMPQWID
eukprot:g9903.t1